MRRASVQSTDPDQEFQSLHTRDFAQRVMLGFIVLDQIAHDVAPPFVACLTSEKHEKAFMCLAIV